MASTVGFELFGIELGDFVAITALIATALIFWFGYSRTRKSEQIKIASELHDKIYTEYLRIRQLAKDNKPYNRTLSDGDKKNWYKATFDERATLIRQSLYFSYLVNVAEITDANVIKYYYPSMVGILGVIDRDYDLAKLDPPARETLDNHAANPENVKKAIRIWKQAERRRKIKWDTMKWKRITGQTDEHLERDPFD